MASLYRKFKLNRDGFSITESIVGILVFSILGSVLLFTVTTLTRAAEITENRNTAINILQQSQEEVRKLNTLLFDSLENCTFLSSEQPGNDCGFEDIRTVFPRFRRALAVEAVNGDNELKKVHITVFWEEWGRTRRLDSVVDLTRPADALPGNIRGAVRNEDTNDLIPDVAVTVTLSGSAGPRSTYSTGVLDENRANYDYQDPDTGRPELPVGLWQLTAEHDGYLDYTHHEPVSVLSDATTVVDFVMEPKPEDARICGQVVDAANGNSRLPVFSRAQVNIYEQGSVQTRFYNATQYCYDVEFSDPEVSERCLTINTNNAFKMGYAYPTASGGAPSCLFNNQREGWSSAVVQEDLSLSCSHPYNGSADTDRICVSSGQQVTRDIPLYPVPTVTITGRVVDDAGAPVANATLRARWPRSDQAWWYIFNSLQTVRTNSQGRFTFVVPAVQEMFPVDNNQTQFASTSRSNNNLQVEAYARFSVQGCCSAPVNQTAYSPRVYVGPLFDGGGGDVGDIVITRPGDQDCGDASGVVTNDRSGRGVEGAVVEIHDISENTSLAGQYVYQCPPEQDGYSLRQGQSVFEARQDCCYPFTSAGNTWYANVQDVVITANEVAEYNARLWPISFARLLEVVVKAQGTDALLSGMQVTLEPYTGPAVEDVTDGAGQAAFTDVIETWPPAALPADPYYLQDVRRHTIRVQDPSGVYLPSSITSPALNDGDSIEVEIFMTKQGAL